MEENEKTEQHLEEEQLQDVTGGISLGSLFGRGSKADALNKINDHQSAAAGLFKRGNERGGAFGDRLKAGANAHRDEINKLNEQIRGF